VPTAFDLPVFCYGYDSSKNGKKTHPPQLGKGSLKPLIFDKKTAFGRRRSTGTMSKMIRSIGCVLSVGVREMRK
jgi:hypothetical protein